MDVAFQQAASGSARWRIVFVLTNSLILALPFVVPVASGQENQKAIELKNLEGTWREESHLVGGMQVPGGKITVTFRTNTMIWKFPPSSWPGAIDHITNYFELNPNSNPKTLVERRINPPGFEYSQRKAYRLSGDKLEICYRLGIGDVAPKVFESKKGSDLVLITLKRVKKEK